MRLTSLFKAFFESEKTGGLILVIAASISITLANSIWSDAYLSIWHYDIGGKPTEYWINDGLMAIFFLLIGLELEREVYIGELSNLKNASLPIVGAIGGMIVPAGLYLMLNAGTDTQSGAGIPMATDIAFAIGILSLAGKRVPTSLKVFLTALAVIDDLGAILVIAIFYTETIAFQYLMGALGIFALLLIFNRLKIRNLIPYLLLGIVMWWMMLNSGIHATITGVMLAFAIPFGNGNQKSTSYILQHALHYPVAFVILPLFALANTGIVVEDGWTQSLAHHAPLGIIIGLLVGKPLGIWLFSFLATKSGLCRLPGGMTYRNLLGVGFLGGIGFTMSIFITLLAFDDQRFIDISKMAILLASCASGMVGFLLLRFWTKRSPKTAS